MIPSISFSFRSPWKILRRLENLWYDIVIRSHVSPCLFHNSFNIAWTGLFHHLLIPKQNHMVLVSWLSFFPFASSIVGAISWLSRILPRVGKMVGARFAVCKALVCAGYILSILINSDLSFLVVRDASLFMTPAGMAAKHTSVCVLVRLRYFNTWFSSGALWIVDCLPETNTFPYLKMESSFCLLFNCFVFPSILFPQ